MPHSSSLWLAARLWLDGSALNGRFRIYDLVQHQDIVAIRLRDLLFTAGTIEPGGGAQLFGDLSIVRTKFPRSPSYSSSTYYDTNANIPTRAITLPVGHPQNPTAGPVMLRYRCPTCRRRRIGQRYATHGAASAGPWQAGMPSLACWFCA